ncbi:MAG TPA: DHA2 family efflux MFS transporter permease subunit [Candidatus Eremiobacteraceae bacterium]|nr:DHA2 family efflux MFS transporter permease subunit [Candidatus Eremiobacteraceae bacterium]
MATRSATFDAPRPSTNGHAAAPAPSPNAVPHGRRIAGNKWLISLPVMLAALIAVLDSSIVNVALPTMQASFGSGVDEIDWVITGYLISNVIVIPATGWLAGTFGLTRYFIGSQIVFLAGSVLCGLSWNLPSLVFFRVLQGIGGGAILPVSLTIMLEAFPPGEFGMASALYGIGAVLGPAIGPTLGGYLTDTFSWPAIFYINVPLVVLSIVLTQAFVHVTERPAGAGRIDVVGLLTVAVWLGSLQLALQEGRRDGWFDSPFIISLFVISFLSFAAFLYTELRVKQPLINLRIFKDLNFAAGSFGGALVGVSLFGSVFIVPLFAGTLLNYTALQIGLVVLPAALVSLVLFPVAGRIANRVDPRVQLTIGIILMAAGMFGNAYLNLQYSFTGIMLVQMLRGAALPFLFTSAGQLALTGIAPKEKADASSLYNLMRTLGGSIGIAVIGTLIVNREVFHFERFGESVTQFAVATRERLAALTNGFAAHSGAGSYESAHLATAALSQTLTQQAFVSAFDDASFVLGVTSLAMLFLVPIFKVQKQAASGPPALAAD